MTLALAVVIIFSLAFLNHLLLPLCAKSGSVLGNMWGNTVYLLSGAMVMLLFLLFTAPGKIGLIFSCTGYSYVIAALNVVCIWLIIVFLPKTGSGLMFVFNSIGSFSASLLMDHFDLAGTGTQPVTFGRVVSVLMIIGGGILFTFFNGHREKTADGGSLQEAKAEDGKSLRQKDAFPLYAFFGILIGVFSITVDAVDSVNSRIVGMAPAILMFLGISGVLALIISFFTDRQGLLRFRKASPAFCLPGIVNALIIGAAAVILPVTGVSLYNGILFFACNVAAIAADQFGLFGLRKIRTGPGRILGSAVMIAGVIALS